MTYTEELVEQYEIPFPKDENNIKEWVDKDNIQRTFLLDNYGESSRHISDFANQLRAEKISESYFRQIVRLEMDKCFKRINLKQLIKISL
jgi:hypothetical protein